MASTQETRSESEHILHPDAAARTGDLKGRPLECILLVKQGLSSKEIARKLGLSPRTVDSHIAIALDRLGAPNRAAAVHLLAGDRELVSDVPTLGPMMLTDPQRANEDYVMAAEDRRVTAWHVPSFGGALNTAGRDERLRWILWIAALSVMISCIFILSVSGVSHMVANANG